MSAVTQSALPAPDALRDLAADRLARLGASVPAGEHVVTTPLTGTPLAEIAWHAPEQVDEAVARAQAAFRVWRDVPAPVRGALVKRFGELLAEHKADLADLVSLEAGKIRSEALGEVQEMIDVCDFAVGLSRQLYGRTMPSERPGHRLMETWHPLGVVGVISAFNFPVAVWAWNTAVALVCGDTVVWKPSETTPLTALGLRRPAGPGRARGRRARATSARSCSAAPRSASALVDHPDVAAGLGDRLDPDGREVGPRVAARFGRSLLELGGNNAAVVAPSADLDLAVRGIVFSAAGTAGQRCTTLRRVIVALLACVDELVERLVDGLRPAAGRRPAAPTARWSGR